MNLDWDDIDDVNFDLEFDLLLGHCTFMQKVFQSEQKQLNEKFNNMLTKTREEQKEKVFASFSDDQYYIKVFSSLQWSAMFIAAFNLFEKTINQICKIVQGISGHKFGFQDLKGKGIERAKLYLSKIHDVIEPFSSQEWNRIKLFSKVRNVFSHTLGELDLTHTEHQEVFKIVQKEESIRIESHDSFFNTASIIVSEEFVFSSIEVYCKFIRILKNEIKNKASNPYGSFSN